MLKFDEDYHVHSNYNDHSSNDLTIKNAVEQAKRVGLKSIAFTEHVRRSSEWISNYLSEIESVKSAQGHSIRIIPGFEAKILADGSIDCPEWCQEYFVIASFHTHYSDKRVWIKALEAVIENRLVDVIGHLLPERSFALESEELDMLSQKMAANDKIVEINAKYHAPPADWLRILKRNGVRFHLASDAHDLGRIGRFESISDLLAVVL